MANYQTKEELEKLVRRYKKRIGLDPLHFINIHILSDKDCPKKMEEACAWIEIHPTHPFSHLYVRRSFLRRCKDHPRIITRIMVHELLHIPIGDALVRFKPSYDYNKDKDIHIEESLVSRMARAIVPLNSEEERIYNEE